SMGCVLLATIGGFGSVFNLLVLPDIRCYARISIFIMFFSLVAVGILLTMALSKAGKGRWTRIGGLACLTIVAAFGIADQDEAASVNALKTEDEQKFRIQSEFVRRMEAGLPAGAAVYQMPDIPLVSGGVNRTTSTAHGEPYVLSTRLRWSWPAVSSKSISLAEKLALLDGVDLVDTLCELGFGGIYIDRFGYSDGGEGLVRSIGEYVHRAPLVSSDLRYVFFGLTEIARKPVSERLAEYRKEPGRTLDEYVWGLPIIFGPKGNAAAYLKAGWASQEPNAPLRCTDGKTATMYFDVGPAASDVNLKVRLRPALFGDIRVRPVVVFANDVQVGQWEVREPGWFAASIRRDLAEKKARLSLRFELPNAVAPRDLGINSDYRVLSVCFEEMALQATRPEGRH
ncbi:MAG: hypothetical protein ABSC05_36595, partial [Candidatus Solibacter sp.]